MISAIGSASTGMQRAGDQLQRAAAKVAAPGGDPIQGSVEEMAASAALEASATMARAAGELIGSLLHVVA